MGRSTARRPTIFSEAGFGGSVRAIRPRRASSARSSGAASRLARENGWRARKIQADLEKLGFTVSLATVSRYLPKRRPDEQERQRWTAFLRNHRDVITGMELFVVSTIRFQLLYAWFIIDHGRREVLHFNVTTNPTAPWVVQQLRESFPGAAAASYLIFDNDSIFSEKVAEWVGRLGMMPKRTAYRSP